jgi:hypothetical protein
MAAVCIVFSYDPIFRPAFALWTATAMCRHLDGERNWGDLLAACCLGATAVILSALFV